MSTTPEQAGEARSPFMVAAILRAMADGYSDRHAWDHLDAEVCRQAADQLAALAAPAQPEAQAVVPAGHAYLCRAWGETDLPCVAIARSRDEVRQFYIDMWLGDEDATDYYGTPMVPNLMVEFDDHPWGDGEPITYEFDIGGVSVERVFA